MTIHISARMAWHMDGWNGRVCKEPAANRYGIEQLPVCNFLLEKTYE